MSAKTKIIVLHMKEVIYTGIFLLLAVILAIVLFFMFGPGQKKSASADAKSRYKPGIYTSSIDLPLFTTMTGSIPAFSHTTK